MRNLCAFIGIIVVLVALASSGALAGDVCAGSLGCVGASHRGITLHGKETP